MGEHTPVLQKCVYDDTFFHSHPTEWHNEHSIFRSSNVGHRRANGRKQYQYFVAFGNGIHYQHLLHLVGRDIPERFSIPSFVFSDIAYSGCCGRSSHCLPSDDIELVNAALRESKHARHLLAPKRLSPFESSQVVSFATNPNLRSLNIRSDDFDCMASSLLEGIRINRHLISLHVELRSNWWEMNDIERICCLVLNGNVSLREFTIHLVQRRCTSRASEHFIRCLLACKDGWGLSCISVSFTDMSDELQFLPDNVTWDHLIAPTLSLNWYRRQSPINLADAGLIGLAIAAINRGVVYRHTTRHKALDMGPAKTTLIYKMLRNNFAFISSTCKRKRHEHR